MRWIWISLTLLACSACTQRNALDPFRDISGAQCTGIPVAAHETPNLTTMSVTVDGALLYQTAWASPDGQNGIDWDVSDLKNALQIWDTTDPEGLVERGLLIFGDDRIYHDVSVQDGLLALLSLGPSGQTSLVVIDVNNPDQPTIVSTLDMDAGQRPKFSTWMGDFLYIADGDVQMIDLTDPENPIAVQRDAPPNGRSIALDDRLLMITRDVDGDPQPWRMSEFVPQDDGTLVEGASASPPLDFTPVTGLVTTPNGVLVGGTNYDDPASVALLQEGSFGWEIDAQLDVPLPTPIVLLESVANHNDAMAALYLTEGDNGIGVALFGAENGPDMVGNWRADEVSVAGIASDGQRMWLGVFQAIPGTQTFSGLVALDWSACL